VLFAYEEIGRNLKKQTGHIYVWTASLIPLSIIERITAFVKKGTTNMRKLTIW
jgi:hypothetical protein